MDKNFETMATEATIAWPMIMHLDNKDNIGPNLRVLDKSGDEKKKDQQHSMKTMQEN